MAFSFLTQELAIDLGTANTVIFMKDKIVVDEPSIIAIDMNTKKPMAVGREAQMMLGKTNPNIKTITMLYSFYNKMILYHLSPDKDNDTVRKIFGGSDYFLRKKVEVASRFTMPQLMKIMSVLREYDLKAKGVDTEVSEGDQLKEMIYKITH